MSWLRGKKGSVTNLKAEEANLTRSTTPTPGNPDGKEEKRTFRSGLLTIRVMWAEGVSMPPGVAIPPAVQSALSSQQAKVAASVSPSSVNQQRLANKSRGNRCAFLICFHDTLQYSNYRFSPIGIASNEHNVGGCPTLSWNTRSTKSSSLLSEGTLRNLFTCTKHTCEFGLMCNVISSDILPFFPAMSLGTLKFPFNVTSVRKSLNVVEMGLQTTLVMMFS